MADAPKKNCVECGKEFTQSVDQKFVQTKCDACLAAAKTRKQETGGGK